MTKFITGGDLEKAIYDIIWDAEETLLIVSPYIRLDDYFRKLFDKHLNNPNLHLLVIFGKNEREVNRSLSKDDFDYFKKFLNVSVVYVPNLHAKYYGNERKGVITSINLYDYSFKNNIEFGVFSETNILNAFKTNPSHGAWSMSMHMANNFEAVFIKRPVYKKNILSPLLGKRYIKSDVMHDITNKFYGDFGGLFGRNIQDKSVKKKLKEFPTELELGPVSATRPQREEVDIASFGYCIRTGRKIPYNPKKPYSLSSYEVWAQFKNVDYPESYCHKTGKPSFGKTSMRNPILK